MGHSVIIPQCKVCNSKFRNLIEELSVKGMSPQKIYDYLQTLKGKDKDLVVKEDINPSAIRRHIAKHFNIKDGINIKTAETQLQLEKSRDSYKQGVAITIDKINTTSHLIETAMIKIEEVEQLNNPVKEHQLIIQYMNSIKGLIETLGKLTGDLKQEGTIDINFFNTEIEKFAEIVLLTIKEMDKKLGLNSQLEYEFAKEFKSQMQDYAKLQAAKINGEIPLNYGNEIRNVNTFNET